MKRENAWIYFFLHTNFIYVRFLTNNDRTVKKDSVNVATIFGRDCMC
jgi:hypothetical protein